MMGRHVTGAARAKSLPHRPRTRELGQHRRALLLVLPLGVRYPNRRVFLRNYLMFLGR
jgi:hypothetical protein